MVKGAQKQMVVLKINDSEVFEEAYFLVRRGADAARMDMLTEANRIVEECGIGRKRKLKANVRLIVFSVASFLAGGAVGAMLVSIAAILS